MSVNDVYTKLRTAPNYHPASVDLFDDCTLQAGDVVTVRSGNDSYALPIFSQHLVWNGVSTTQLESTGNEKRSDLPPLRKREMNTAYGLGAGGYGTQKQNEEKFKQYETHFEQTDMYFSFLATESQWDELAQEGHVTAYTQILQTARDVSIVAAKTGIDGLAEGETLYSKINVNAEAISTEVARATGAETTLSSRITQTADAITTEVTNRTNADTALSSRITQNADKISLVVTGTGENAHVSSASIIAAITNDSGRLSSSITVDADKVYIGNQTSTTVINGKCSLSDVTADYIAGKIATLSTLNGISASFSGNVSCSGLLAGAVYVGSNGSYTNISNGVRSVVLTGPVDNVYTLTSTLFNGTYQSYSFSRATTLTGAWSSGKFTVNASPQGASYWTDITQGTASLSGKTYTVPINATDSTSGGNSYATGRNVTVDASTVYTNGYNDGKPVSGTAGGRTSGVTALVHDFTIKKGDNTTTTLSIDCTNIYATARSGYTYGTFTAATVTLQGSQDSVFIEAASGGTDYYQAGTAATYYNAGTADTYYKGDGGEFTVQGESEVVYPGNGTSGYLRGDSVTITKQGSAVTVYPRGTTYYYIRHSSSETPTSAWYTRTTSQPSSGTTYDRRFADGGSETYYTAGSDVTYYKGNGSYVYGRGTAMTRYAAGTVTKYARGDSVSVTPIGTSVSVTPIKTNTKKHLLATTRYKAGTTYSSTYYTKS